jgi:hypothetical protein
LRRRALLAPASATRTVQQRNGYQPQSVGECTGRGTDPAEIPTCDAAACERNRAYGRILDRPAAAAIVGAEPAGIVLPPRAAIEDVKTVPADLGLSLEGLTAARADRERWEGGIRHGSKR